MERKCFLRFNGGGSQLKLFLPKGFLIGLQHKFCCCFAWKQELVSSPRVLFGVQGNFWFKEGFD